MMPRIVPTPAGYELWVGTKCVYFCVSRLAARMEFHRLVKL